MKKPFACLTTVLVYCFLVNGLWATEATITIEGRILKVEPSKSITVEIEKSKGIELSLTEIKTLAVVDPKKLTDGVGTTAVIGGISGGVANRLGVANPPKSLQRSKRRDTALVSLATTFFSATLRVVYNHLTKKSPKVVYDSDNESINNVANITLLPLGTKVRISQKNHINGTRSP